MKKTIKVCKICGIEYNTYIKNAKYCNRKCYHLSKVGKPTWNKNKKTGKLNVSCITCGKAFHLKLSSINRGRGKYCSKSCYNIGQSKRMQGKGNHQFGQSWGSMENNPNWRGGTSFEEYPKEFNKELKEVIRKRDNYCCCMCGAPEKEYFSNLSIHHIDYNKYNQERTNLITLCRSCHTKTNFSREDWTRFFHEEVMPNAPKEQEYINY